MRIPTLAWFVKNFTTSAVLDNYTLVIDAQNFFHSKYKESKLQFIFGCESDKYLEFLKRELVKFKMANVKCYFILKGGDKFMDNKIKSHEKKRPLMAGQKLEEMGTVSPIFMLEIHRQVLKDMGFDYVVCEYESKRECMALAQKLNCPVVSFDVEFCFSGVPYISYLTLRLDQRTQTLKGDIFTLDNFLHKLGVDEDKLAIFAAMMDQKNDFPTELFTKLLNSVMKVVPEDNCKKYEKIFQWLARKTHNELLKNIVDNIAAEDQAKFLEIRDQVKDMIRRQETPGIASEYILNECHIDITPQDPLWFEKGVASGTISKPYVNLYRASTVFGSEAIVDHVNKVYDAIDKPDEPLLLSSEIIRYAYDLLTNFQGRPFEIISSHSANILVPSRIPKPVYEAKESVFENGWDNIKSLGLLEHFLAHTIPGCKLQTLEELPGDAKLLMIVLLFFKWYSNNEAKNEIVGSVLLSYVFLGVLNVSRETIESSNSNWEAERAFSAVTEADKKQAKNMLSKYVTHISYQTACNRFEPKLMYPLVEFQQCLQHFAFLNKLCGSPYKPIVFSKMYNGTFVYRVLYKMVQKGDVLGFLTEELSSAPTVFGLMKNLLNVYNEV